MSVLVFLPCEFTPLLLEADLLLLIMRIAPAAATPPPTNLVVFGFFLALSLIFWIEVRTLPRLFLPLVAESPAFLRSALPFLPMVLAVAAAAAPAALTALPATFKAVPATFIAVPAATI